MTGGEGEREGDEMAASFEAVLLSAQKVTIDIGEEKYRLAHISDSANVSDLLTKAGAKTGVP